MYRLKVHGVETSWQLLNLNHDLYKTSIEGPGAFTTLHWRASEVAKALAAVESDVCKVIDLRITEITVWEACRSHRDVCQACQYGEECHDGDKLEQYVQEAGPEKTYRSIEDP